jgi:hypothetical protein
MKKQDREQQLVEYSDTYVAFVGDIRHVVTTGSTMSEVYKQLKDKNITNATITYIPPVDKSVSFLVQPAIWADYDPEKVREGLRKSAGALKSIDHEALQRDIRSQR